MTTTESEKQSGPKWGWGRVGLILALVLLAMALFGEKGILRAVKLNREKQILLEDLRRLEETNAALRKEIESLRGDRRYLEGMARQELGMVRDDELVYQFPPGEEGAEKNRSQPRP